MANTWQTEPGGQVPRPISEIIGTEPGGQVPRPISEIIGKECFGAWR
jgi:hypothetical protein